MKKNLTFIIPCAYCDHKNKEVWKQEIQTPFSGQAEIECSHCGKISIFSLSTNVRGKS
jgi:transposase